MLDDFDLELELSLADDSGSASWACSTADSGSASWACSTAADSGSASWACSAKA